MFNFIKILLVILTWTAPAMATEEDDFNIGIGQLTDHLKSNWGYVIEVDAPYYQQFAKMHTQLWPEVIAAYDDLVKRGEIVITPEEWAKLRPKNPAEVPLLYMIASDGVEAFAHRVTLVGAHKPREIDVYSTGFFKWMGHQQDLIAAVMAHELAHNLQPVSMRALKKAVAEKIADRVAAEVIIRMKLNATALVELPKFFAHDRAKSKEDREELLTDEHQLFYLRSRAGEEALSSSTQKVVRGPLDFQKRFDPNLSYSASDPSTHPLWKAAFAKVATGKNFFSDVKNEDELVKLVPRLESKHDEYQRAIPEYLPFYALMHHLMMRHVKNEADLQSFMICLERLETEIIEKSQVLRDWENWFGGDLFPEHGRERILATPILESSGAVSALQSLVGGRMHLQRALMRKNLEFSPVLPEVFDEHGDGSDLIQSASDTLEQFLLETGALYLNTFSSRERLGPYLVLLSSGGNSQYAWPLLEVLRAMMTEALELQEAGEGVDWSKLLTQLLKARLRLEGIIGFSFADNGGNRAEAQNAAELSQFIGDSEIALIKNIQKYIPVLEQKKIAMQIVAILAPNASISNASDFLRAFDDAFGLADSFDRKAENIEGPTISARQSELEQFMHEHYAAKITSLKPFEITTAIENSLLVWADLMPISRAEHPLAFQFMVDPDTMQIPAPRLTPAAERLLHANGVVIPSDVVTGDMPVGWVDTEKEIIKLEGTEDLGAPIAKISSRMEQFFRPAARWQLKVICNFASGNPLEYPAADLTRT